MSRVACLPLPMADRAPDPAARSIAVPDPGAETTPAALQRAAQAQPYRPFPRSIRTTSPPGPSAIALKPPVTPRCRARARRTRGCRGRRKTAAPRTASRRSRAARAPVYSGSEARCRRGQSVRSAGDVRHQRVVRGRREEQLTPVHRDPSGERERERARMRVSRCSRLLVLLVALLAWLAPRGRAMAADKPADNEVPPGMAMPASESPLAKRLRRRRRHRRRSRNLRHRSPSQHEARVARNCVLYRLRSRHRVQSVRRGLARERHAGGTITAATWWTS